MLPLKVSEKNKPLKINKQKMLHPSGDNILNFEKYI